LALCLKKGFLKIDWESPTLYYCAAPAKPVERDKGNRNTETSSQPYIG